MSSEPITVMVEKRPDVSEAMNCVRQLFGEGAIAVFAMVRAGAVFAVGVDAEEREDGHIYVTVDDEPGPQVFQIPSRDSFFRDVEGADEQSWIAHRDLLAMCFGIVWALEKEPDAREPLFLVVPAEVVTCIEYIEEVMCDVGAN